MAAVCKILVTGPFNSGKTSFIGAISEIGVVSTEKPLIGSEGRRRTTVAMDYGRITLPGGDVLHLYGTPGQRRFDFMWGILAEGMLGYVVLVDGTDPGRFEEAERIMDRFRGASDAPFVIGITRGDREECAAPGTLGRRLPAGDDPKMLKCDARRREDVKSVLLELLEAVLERAGAYEQAG